MLGDAAFVVQEQADVKKSALRILRLLDVCIFL
jgi:hypothetical protein